MLGNLQFDFSSGEPDSVRGTTILTRFHNGSIDLGWLDGERERYARLRGKNLQLLLPRILRERQVFFTPGMECPDGCSLEKVERQDGLLPEREDCWAPPDRNRCPPWLFCVETGHARWYLDFLSLQKFGPSKLKGHKECLLQFASRIHVVAHPLGDADLWGQLRASNMDLGTLNKISVWADDAYAGAGIGGARYAVHTVRVEQRQLAASGEWGMAPAARAVKKEEPTRETGGMEL